MASTDATIFPPQNKAYRIPVRIVDTSGVLITGWTGAASVVIADGTLLGAGATPVEVSSTGEGYLDLTATQMNGRLIQGKCTVTNSNAVAYSFGIYTYPPFTNGNGSGTSNTLRPTDPIGWLAWLFQYFFCGGNLSRSTGIQTVLDNSGANLTEIQTSGTDIEFNKFKSNP